MGNKPRIRFKGFTEDWEQRKLTSFIQRVKGNDGRMDLPTLTISASEGWLNQKDRFSANIAGSEQKNYTLLRQGELSYNHGNSKLAKYGVVYVLKDYKEALVPRVYHSFKVDESYDALFVEYYFSTKRPDRELAKLVSSGARMDGLLNIGYDEFANISIAVPTFSEQRQIVALLRRFDKFITLHQCKLEKLKLTKKALLQKLFPKNGKHIPEIRFKGFTDAWEQRKFGELFTLKSGVAFKLSEYTKTGIPIINGESIKAGEISLEKVNYLPSEYQYKYQECLLFPGDIVLGLNRPIINGALKISRIPSAIKTSLLYQRAGKIIFKVNMEENFTYQLLSKEVLTFTRKEAVGSDQPFITTTKLNKWDLRFPVKDEERRKIGNLFDNINNIITLHQRKLERLQEVKKGLLQKMFV